MKKLFPLALVACLALPLVAQEAANEEETATAPLAEREISRMWPAPVAVCQWPRALDVVGLRLTIPFSNSQENVTGLDLGFWGKSIYFEGIQVNVLRNDVKDAMAGFQFGIYNSVSFGDLCGIQVGLWNEAVSFTGLQAGLVNIVGEGDGFQVGLINRAESLHGYQVGIINIIRDAEVQFMPVVNIGF